MPVYGDLLYLNGHKEVTDQTPFIFRRSGGDAGLNLGKRCKQTFVGGGVAWNQLAKNDVSGWKRYGDANNTSLTYSDNEFTLTLTATSSLSVMRRWQIAVENDHVYYMSADMLSSDGNYSVRLTLYSGITTVSGNKIKTSSTTYVHGETICKAGSSGKYVIGMAISTSETLPLNSYGKWKNVVVTDLTRMVGPTVADYVYDLEQNEDGSGIAWLKHFGFFRRGSYAYDPGSIQSVCLSGYFNTDSNLFNGVNKTTKLVGGYSYKIEGTYNSLSYERFDGSSETIVPDENNEFMPTNDGVLTVTGASSSFYLHFVFDGSHDGKPEPHAERPQWLQTIGLQGILELLDGKLVYNGDVFKHDGSITRKYKLVDLGTLTWTRTKASVGDNYYYKTSSWAGYGPKPLTKNVLISKKYTSVAATEVRDNNYSFAVNSTGLLYIRDDDYITSDSFKSAVAGTYFLYELGEYRSETVSSFRYPMPIDSWGTEEFIDGYYTAGTRDVEIPVGHSTVYYDMDRTRGDTDEES